MWVLRVCSILFHDLNLHTDTQTHTHTLKHTHTYVREEVYFYSLTPKCDILNAFIYLLQYFSPCLNTPSCAGVCVQCCVRRGRACARECDPRGWGGGGGSSGGEGVCVWVLWGCVWAWGGGVVCIC